MDYKSIIKIYFGDNYSVHIELGIILLGIATLIGLVFLIRFLTQIFSNRYSQDIELNISLGGIGEIKIKPNYEVLQVAHKAWAELITRKAGLPIDIENDVIVEIYQSWYVLFDEIRQLIKQIPASQLKNQDTKKLSDLLVNSLNQGLRPHLTKWNARFRRWYNNEIEKNKDKTPQEIQKKYPSYNELIADLMIINQQLVSYTNELKKLV